MKKIKILLEGLGQRSGHAQSQNWPFTEGNEDLLLYEDPDYDFVVNAVVHTPGRDGRIHDHALRRPPTACSMARRN